MKTEFWATRSDKLICDSCMHNVDKESRLSNWTHKFYVICFHFDWMVPMNKSYANEMCYWRDDKTAAQKWLQKRKDKKRSNTNNGDSFATWYDVLVSMQKSGDSSDLHRIRIGSHIEFASIECQWLQFQLFSGKRKWIWSVLGLVLDLIGRLRKRRE